MADGKKIKELAITEIINDTDDFIIENGTPSTMRVKWSTIVSKITTLSDAEIDEIYNELYS